MLLSGLLEGHTRLLLSRTRRKTKTPHAHPHQQETTQPSNTSKRPKQNNTPQRHENKRDRHSKTEHEQDAGPQLDRKANNSSPNSRIKNQGLAEAKKGQKEKHKTNEQPVPATHLSYLKQEDTQKATQRKQKQDPGGRKGSESTNQRQKKDSYRPPPAD